MMKLSSEQKSALNIIRSKTNVNGLYVTVNGIPLTILRGLEKKGFINLILDSENDFYARLEYPNET